MASAKIDPTDRAAVAKKAADLKVTKAKKPVVTRGGEMLTRDEAAKRAFKTRLKK